MTSSRRREGEADDTSPANFQAARAEGPRAETIQHMFNQIAGRYDLANTLMSAGIHYRWRRSMIRWSGLKAGDHVLDCATGTGDLAIELKKTVAASGQVTATDFSENMLAVARRKVSRKALDITFEQADVTDLEFPDASFDMACISFGIRNVQYPVRGLSEMARVVRPGGIVMVLEFGQPTIPVFSGIYRFYSNHILPRIGGVVTGRRKAYEYLQDSSAHFPCGERFLDLMARTERFETMEYKPISLGIAYIYKGVVRN